jgi:beta-phosphoglucomutase
MAIGSSSKNTKYILYRIGLLDFFNAIVDGNDISHSKPNPEVFLKAAEKLKVNPEYTYVLEDAVSGIEAAKNGGFIPIAIGPASFSKDAKFIIKKFSDLNNILK